MVKNSKLILCIRKANLTHNRSFLGQSILALLLCGLIAVLLPSEIKRKEDDASQMVDNNIKPAKKKRSVDYPGLILFAAMLTGFLLTLDFAGQGVSIKATAMIVTLVLFAASTIAFFLTEIYFVEKPLIPFSLLRNKGLGVQLLIQILLLNSQFSVRRPLSCFSWSLVEKFDRSYQTWEPIS